MVPCCLRDNLRWSSPLLHLPVRLAARARLMPHSQRVAQEKALPRDGASGLGQSGSGGRLRCGDCPGAPSGPCSPWNSPSWPRRGGWLGSDYALPEALWLEKHGGLHGQRPSGGQSVILAVVPETLVLKTHTALFILEQRGQVRCVFNVDCKISGVQTLPPGDAATIAPLSP